MLQLIPLLKPPPLKKQKKFFHHRRHSFLLGLLRFWRENTFKCYHRYYCTINMLVSQYTFSVFYLFLYTYICLYLNTKIVYEEDYFSRLTRYHGRLILYKAEVAKKRLDVYSISFIFLFILSIILIN